MKATETSGSDLLREIHSLYSLLVGRDRQFIYITLIYGLAISLLTLALPISVQMLINSVTQTASVPAVVTVALILFVLLLFSGALTALQTYVLELFQRRFYARITSKIMLHTIYAEYSHFDKLNRHELMNRFFEIMNAQKIMPSMITGFFSLLLQMVVGVIVVSLYHPWLLLFNLCFILLLWMIWRIWVTRAMRTAINVSEAKYETARHLEEVARANSFYKSATHRDYAIDQTDRLTASYIERRKEHFRHIFSQHISLLLLYALASAGLLGIGGLLVVNEELTLGQLVAAELILSSVFFGISKLSYYLEQYYDLGVAFEEIYRIFHIPAEHVEGKQILPDRPLPLHFDDCRFADEQRPVTLDLLVHPGEKVLASTTSHRLEESMFRSVKRYITPERGRITIGDQDILDINPHHLRERITVLDRPTVIECTIRTYMEIHAPGVNLSDIHEALRLVELQERIESLPHGLETELSIMGDPLNASEVLRLKLAAVWLAEPHVLILNELFDTISYERRRRIFARLCAEENMTVLYFSNRIDLDMFDHFLMATPEEQYHVPTIQALREAQMQNGGEL